MNGIYIIHNIVTNTIYIGQTGKSFDYREKRHKTMLRGGYHSNRHLQNAYNKYGESAFEFDTLEELNTVDTAALDDAEKFWIAYYKSIGADMYNLAAVGKSSLGIKRSSETRRKLSDVWAAKRKPKVINPNPTRKGHKQADTHIQNRVASFIDKRNQLYKFISPDGVMYTTTNLAAFSREHNLTRANMVRVYNGERLHHKGWKVI